MAIERVSSQSGNDGDLTILSNNFGGLNTTASLLNIPFEDSPDILNVDVDIAGNIEKRKGTVTVGINASPNPIYTHPVTTSLAYNFFMSKEGRNLYVYQLQNDVLSLVFSHLDVFSTRAESQKPYFLLLPELEPRILMLTNANAPIHLKFVEQSTSVTSGTPTTSFVVPNAERFQYIASTTTRVFINRVLQPSATITYSSGNLNISGVSSFSGTVTVDVIGTVWQWWSEALRWQGNRFYDTKSRFHVTKTDQNIEIDEPMRSDIQVVNGVYGDYPIQVYSDSTNSSALVRSSQPNTSMQYGFSNGSIYNVGANNFLQPTPFYLTFGDIKTGCTPSPCTSETVFILRRRELRFNNDTNINASDLYVDIDGVQANSNYSASPTGTRTYHTFTETGTLNTSSSGIIRYIAFSGSTPIGVSASSVVRLINRGGVGTIVGANANGTLDSYRNGSIFPVYGLGLFADYLNGSFPSVGVIFQGRLVLSGMRHDPSRVLYSATNDTVEPGVRYNFFQITDDLDNIDTDPFDMVVASTAADDYVNGLAEWQNNLFILTRRAVFKASGGTNTLAPSRRFLNFVSSLGLVNQWSVVRTDVAVYYLSDFGVFNLVPRVEDSEYIADEKSIKIRSLFEGGNVTGLSWMAFDNVKKLLYVALPSAYSTTSASTLLVYNTFRDSWTRYESINRFLTFTGHQYVDRALNEQFMIVCTLPTGTTGFIRTNGDRYVDFLTTQTQSGSYNLNFSCLWYEFTTTSTVRDYLFNQSRTFPFNDIEDITVYYDGRLLVFGVDYVKTMDGVYLLFNPESGKPMRVFYRRPINEGDSDFLPNALNADPFIIWVNNKRYREGVDYNLTKGTTSVQSTVNINLPTNSKVESGYAYPAFYTSPMFVSNQLGTLKRTKHLYLFMDNANGLEKYGTQDIFSNATADEIVGVPKNEILLNVAILYDNQRTGEVSYDLYGYQDLVWDSTFFDTNQSALQTDRHVLLKETLKGVGYSHQVLLWSFDEGVWRVAGYQIDANEKGKRYKQRG